MKKPVGARELQILHEMMAIEPYNETSHTAF